LVRVCVCEWVDEKEHVTACARVCCVLKRKKEREYKGESERKKERGTRAHARTYTPERKREGNKARR